MQYRAIHTSAGLALMAQAQATGAQITLGEIAVGDGGGARAEPREDQTALVGERFRAAINRTYQLDPVGFPTKYASEIVIPASVGGFVLREIALYTGDGTLFVVGNLPETYKPTPEDGAFTDTLARIEYLVSNTDLLTLQSDPNAAVASQQWVRDFVADQMDG